jgi:hypothetical protein
VVDIVPMRAQAERPPVSVPFPKLARGCGGRMNVLFVSAWAPLYHDGGERLDPGFSVEDSQVREAGRGGCPGRKELTMVKERKGLRCRR